MSTLIKKTALDTPSAANPASPFVPPVQRNVLSQALQFMPSGPAWPSVAQRMEQHLADEIQVRARLSPREIKVRNQFQADQHFGTVGQSNSYVHLLRAAGHDYVGAVQGLLEDVGTVMGHDNFASAMRQDRLGNEAAAEHRRQRALDQGHMVQWEQVTSTQTPYSFVSAPRPQDGLALKAATHFIEYGMRLGQYAESLIVQSAADLGVVLAGGIGGRALAGAAGVKSAAGLTVSGIAGASVLSVPANSGRVLAEQRQQSAAHSGQEKTHLFSALGIGALNSVINATLGVDRMFARLKIGGGVGTVLGAQPSKVVSVAGGESAVEMITGSTERLGAKVVETKLQYFSDDYYSNLWAQGRDGFLAGWAVGSSGQVGRGALDAASALSAYLTQPTERIAVPVKTKPAVFHDQGHPGRALDEHTQVGWQHLNPWGPGRVYGMPKPTDDGALGSKKLKLSPSEAENTADTPRPAPGSLADMLHAARQNSASQKSASDLAAAAEKKKEYQNKLDGLSPNHLNHFHNYLRLKAKQNNVLIFDQYAYDMAIEALAKKFRLNSDYMHHDLAEALGMELHDLIHHVGQLAEHALEARQRVRKGVIDLLAYGQSDALELAADFMRIKAHRTTGALEQAVDAQTLDKLQALARALSNAPQSVPTDAAGLHHHLRWLFGTLATAQSPHAVLDAIVAHPTSWVARSGDLPYFDDARVSRLLNQSEQMALRELLSDASLTQANGLTRENLAEKMKYRSWDHLRLAHDVMHDTAQKVNGRAEKKKRHSRVVANAPKSKAPHPQSAPTPELRQRERTEQLGRRYGAMAVPELNDEQINHVVRQLAEGKSLLEQSAQLQALQPLMAYQDMVLNTLELDIQNAQLPPALHKHLQYELRRARLGVGEIEPEQIPSSATVKNYRAFSRKHVRLHADFFEVLDMLAGDAKMRRLLLHPQVSPAVPQRLQALDDALQIALPARRARSAVLRPDNRQSTNKNANLLNPLYRLHASPELDAPVDVVRDYRQFAQEFFALSAAQRAQLGTLSPAQLKFLRDTLLDVLGGHHTDTHNAMALSDASIYLHRSRVTNALELNAVFFSGLKVLSNKPQVRSVLLDGEPGRALSLQLQALIGDIGQVLGQRQRPDRRATDTDENPLSPLNRLRSPPALDAPADVVRDYRQFAQELFALSAAQRAQLETLSPAQLKFLRDTLLDVLGGHHADTQNATTQSVNTIHQHRFQIKTALKLDRYFFSGLKVLSNEPQVRSVLLDGEPGKALSSQLQTLIGDIAQVLEQRQRLDRRATDAIDALPEPQTKENDSKALDVPDTQAFKVLLRPPEFDQARWQAMLSAVAHRDPRAVLAEASANTANSDTVHIDLQRLVDYQNLAIAKFSLTPEQLNALASMRRSHQWLMLQTLDRALNGVTDGAVGEFRQASRRLYRSEITSKLNLSRNFFRSFEALSKNATMRALLLDPALGGAFIAHLKKLQYTVQQMLDKAGDWQQQTLAAKRLKRLQSPPQHSEDQWQVIAQRLREYDQNPQALLEALDAQGGPPPSNVDDQNALVLGVRELVAYQNTARALLHIGPEQWSGLNELNLSYVRYLGQILDRAMGSLDKADAIVLSKESEPGYRRQIQKALGFSNHVFQGLDALTAGPQMRRLLLDPTLGAPLRKPLEDFKQAVTLVLETRVVKPGRAHWLSPEFVLPQISDERLAQIRDLVQQSSAQTMLDALAPVIEGSTPRLSTQLTTQADAYPSGSAELAADLRQIAVFQNAAAHLLAVVPKKLAASGLKKYFMRYMLLTVRSALYGAGAAVVPGMRAPNESSRNEYRATLRKSLDLSFDFFPVLDLLATNSTARALLLDPVLGQALSDQLRQIEHILVATLREKSSGATPAELTKKVPLTPAVSTKVATFAQYLSGHRRVDVLQLTPNEAQYLLHLVNEALARNMSPVLQHNHPYKAKANIKAQRKAENNVKYQVLTKIPIGSLLPDVFDAFLAGSQILPNNVAKTLTEAGGPQQVLRRLGTDLIQHLDRFASGVSPQGQALWRGEVVNWLRDAAAAHGRHLKYLNDILRMHGDTAFHEASRLPYLDPASKQPPLHSLGSYFLSDNERVLIKHLVEGKSFLQIAQAMGMDVATPVAQRAALGTVQLNVSNLRRKFGTEALDLGAYLHTMANAPEHTLTHNQSGYQLYGQPLIGMLINDPLFYEGGQFSPRFVARALGTNGLRILDGLLRNEDTATIAQRNDMSERAVNLFAQRIPALLGADTLSAFVQRYPGQLSKLQSDVTALNYSRREIPEPKASNEKKDATQVNFVTADLIATIKSAVTPDHVKDQLNKLTDQDKLVLWAYLDGMKRADVERITGLGYDEIGVIIGRVARHLMVGVSNTPLLSEVIEWAVGSDISPQNYVWGLFNTSPQ